MIGLSTVVLNRWQKEILVIDVPAPHELTSDKKIDVRKDLRSGSLYNLGKAGVVLHSATASSIEVVDKQLVFGGLR